MLAFSNDYYGMIFSASQSVELFCAYTIEASDVLFLINNNVELNAAKEKVLAGMKEIAEVHITDAENNNSAATGKKLLLQFLQKKSKNDYKVFIIGPSMKCICDDQKEIEKYASSVFYHHNFQVRKIKTVIEKPDDQLNLADLFNDPENQSFPHILNPEAEVKSTRKAEEPKQRKKEMKNKGGQTLSSENTETIEREVFGRTIEKTEYCELHSNLQNAKAALIYELENRLSNHIMKMLFQRSDTVTLTKDQLYNFIIILLKTDSAEKFNESWSASETDPKIDLKSNVFDKIKGEANYYNAVCELLYGEDIWDT